MSHANTSSAQLSEGHTTLAVLAATSDGGHPEYVNKFLRGALDASSGRLHIEWPIQRNATPFSQLPRTTFPKQISHPGSGRQDGWLKWVTSRVNPARRHDLSYIRYLLGASARIDVVLVEELQRFTLPLVVWAAKARKRRPVITHLHNVRRHDYRGSIVDRLDIIATGYGLRSSDAVVVHGEASARLAIKTYSLHEPPVVIPHGLESRVARAYPTPAQPTVLFYGVNRRNKGLRHLIDALKQMEDPPTLVVAGQTPADMREETLALLETYPNAQWHDGFVSPDATEKLFSEATCVVLPYEGFEAQSGVLHLAIEYAVPVVVSDAGDMGETVAKHRLGRVVSLKEPGELRAGLTHVMDATINAELRQNCLSAQANLAWGNSGGKLYELVVDSLKRKVCQSA
ncbi:glycosyltransferase family 4 protein [Quadrisphaera setariae]|uniref:Glycosyltransferase family 4 protein n=1 Tax=Quadrisphaera setariae TaxID=2593304 RepID=A0A5C8ZE33_9ACTN|nr:glycosyltransferase family 4 protein [Quadrisphaera setariae]TXR56315.1 glycosyltransferase family 4 protein [Quadrisphaera setariae]